MFGSMKIYGHSEQYYDLRQAIQKIKSKDRIMQELKTKMKKFHVSLDQ